MEITKKMHEKAELQFLFLLTPFFILHLFLMINFFVVYVSILFIFFVAISIAVAAIIKFG